MRALLKLGTVLATTLGTTLLFLGTPGQEQIAKADTLVDAEGELLSGDAVLDDGSLYDQYTFSGNGGQYATIYLESEDFDPYLILLDPSGQRISENDDVSRANRNSRLIVALPRTGTYTAVANSYESGINGEYAIQIDVTSTRRSLSEVLAVSAVPGSTSVCSGAIAAMTQELEDARDMNAWVSSLELNRLHSNVPTLRPHGVNVDLEGSAALSVIFSPQLLTQLSASLIENCDSVGAVVFSVDEAGYARTFGFIPTTTSSRSQGAEAGAAVREFECSAASDNPSVTAWGERPCS